MTIIIKIFINMIIININNNMIIIIIIQPSPVSSDEDPQLHNNHGHPSPTRILPLSTAVQTKHRKQCNSSFVKSQVIVTALCTRVVL